MLAEEESKQPALKQSWSVLGEQLLEINDRLPFLTQCIKDTQAGTYKPTADAKQGKVSETKTNVEPLPSVAPKEQKENLEAKQEEKKEIVMPLTKPVI